MRDLLVYLSAYLHWHRQPDGGGHTAAKKYAQQETVIARKQRAERAALRGIHT